jgi:hypothetical protein
LFIEGTFEMSGNRFGTVVRMAGDPDRISAQAFDVIVAALRLDINKASRPEVLPIQNSAEFSIHGLRFSWCNSLTNGCRLLLSMDT